MPAFMSIGKEEDWWVEPGDIKGDATGQYHVDWIKITSFGVEMKEERALNNWSGQQQSSTSRRQDREDRDQTPAQESDSEPRVNTLQVTKPHDMSSMKLIEWAKSGVQYDMQVDCCAGEEEDDYPYLSLLFLGVVPTKTDIDDTPSDSLEFTCKKCVTFTCEFDEDNNPVFSDYAEFGEEEASGVTTAAQRGLADYVPPDSDPNEGAGGASGAGPTGLALALVGGLPPVQQETKSYDQERRTLSIEKVGDIEFQLESFRADERLSTLFTCDLELRSDQISIEAADIVGHEVAFMIGDEEGREEDAREPRYFSGIITTFLVGEMASDRRRRYHATVMPTVWRLTQRSSSRVFQEVTVQDVVEQVFSDAGFSDYDLQGVTKTHPTMTYCVQYEESDFAFISRLLEEFGIFYYFKQEEGEHTLMLCDGPTAYVRCPEDPLSFAHDVHNEPRITAWRTHYSFVPGKYALIDYNFETPQEPIKAESTSQIDLPDNDQVEVFEYPGEFSDNEEGTNVADLRMQERETGHHFIHAVGCYDSLAPGMTIAVENLPGEDPDGPASSQRYLITGIRHQAEQLPEFGLSIVGYRNILVAIPEEVTFTPPRRTPRPRILGPQTAVVVGDKETDEGLVDTDKYGRIKVQFHWDREHEKDKDSSCWIRVVQLGSSGSMVIPRIGWEVVVSFINGDPDRPLVTGVVYNELQMPHHELVGAKHKTTLMTHSWPDGGKDNFNELTFHDEKDSEEVYFHAEKDFKHVVEHDYVLEVGEKDTGGQTTTVEGDMAVTVNQGNSERAISQGHDTVTVSWGDQTIDISSGTCKLSAGTAIELKVGGSTVAIDTSSITLTVGGSKVTIDNTGVTIEGMTVKVEASLQAELKGMMTSISGDAMLETKGGITMMQ